VDDDELVRVIEENGTAFRDLRAFLRELTRRHELGFESLLKESARQTEVLTGLRVEILHELREGALMRELRDGALMHELREGQIVQELRAQRQALFRIFDRLDGNGGAAGA
jgi:hypothetical protein